MQRTDNAAYKVIREYFAALCSSSFDPATVANALFSKKIINEALRDETTRGTSKNDQRRALVDAVMRAGRPGTFQTFLQILHKDDSYLAEQIRDAYQRATGKTIPLEEGQATTSPVVPTPPPPVVPTPPPPVVPTPPPPVVPTPPPPVVPTPPPPVVPTPPPPVVPTPPPPNVITTPTTSTLSTECTSTTTVTAQVVGNGNTSVTIQSNVGAVITKMVGDDYCMVSSDGGSPNPAYKMAGNPVHGIALIISNCTFDKGLKYRAGGEVDEVNLLELFGSKYLNYKVVFLKDLKKDQIDMALRLVSGHKGFSYIQLGKNDKKALEALSPADNLIAASHDSFVCCLMSHGDQGVVHGTDGKTFDLENIYNYLGGCGHLTGKPKMVFIQAAQGDAIAEHVVEDDGHTTKTADFLLSFAAFCGQKSFEGEGSWYVNALCNTFKENYKSKDVVSMITDVHKEVMKQEAKDAEGGVCLQCPRLEHTLRHKVHLFAVEGGWFGRSLAALVVGDTSGAPCCQR